MTFRYRATDTGRLRTSTLPAEEFIRRFLQHVLPKHFVKVRYYGFFSPGLRPRLASLRQQLDTASADTETRTAAHEPNHVVRCPSCGRVMQRRPIPKGRAPP